MRTKYGRFLWRCSNGGEIKFIDIIEKNDILLILGKGHENYQIIGKTKYHLDDAEEVLNYKK